VFGINRLTLDETNRSDIRVEAHHVEFRTVLLDKHLSQSFPIGTNPELDPVGFPFLSDGSTST
jgi:hypothetical protein